MARALVPGSGEQRLGFAPGPMQGYAQGPVVSGACPPTSTMSYNMGSAGFNPALGSAYGPGPFGGSMVGPGGPVMTGGAMQSGSFMGPGGPMGPPPGMVTPVPVPNDPCGCGPSASAGDCSGTCGGAETLCCEPAGGAASVQWVQTSGGGYAPVTNYQYVGEGCGTYERQVVTQWYGWRLRKCCLCLLCLLLLLPLLWLLMGFLTPPETQPPEVVPQVVPTPAPPAPVLGPAKTCLVFGDPHVKTFDGCRSDYYTSGEYWIVKSDEVQIQGRYLPTHMTNNLAVTKEIAISGSFIGGAKIIIGVDTVTFNGDMVMKDFATFGTWSNANPPVDINYNSQGEIMQKSRAGKALHVVHVSLPRGVKLEINRWKEPGEGEYINTRITMPSVPGQDGHCGNFNSNADDDKRVAVRERVGRTGVPQEALIFPGPKTPVNPGNRPDLNDCPEGKLKVAMEQCKAAEKKFFPSHACLIDACLGGIAPKVA